MSAGEENSGEKAFEPTPQKLEDARRKGNIPRSMDVSAAAVFFGLFLALALNVDATMARLLASLSRFMSDPDRMAGVVLAPGGRNPLGGFFTEFGAGIAVFLGLPFVAALLAFAAQRAFIFTPSKIVPKLSRLSLLENAKSKFGANGLVQFAKSVTKLLAISIALFWYLDRRRDDFLGAIRTDHWTVSQLMGQTIYALLGIAVAIFAIIALIDLLWQRYHHAQKLRMTHQEVRDEHKQTEGDPHMKSERRAKGQALATNRMLLDVPKADVVIVNPTHFAVALTWSRKRGEAPRCVAKGTDEIAARIREFAGSAGVPIHRDPPTARAIFAGTEIGEEVHPDQYRAVAAAIRFAERMREKARARGQ